MLRKYSSPLLLLLLVFLLSACRTRTYYPPSAYQPATARPATAPAAPATPARQFSMQALQKAANALGIEITGRDDHALLVECADWMGTPYRYGGDASKAGTDCSALTKYIYNKVYGLSLHRRSQDQWTDDVDRIPIQRVKQGDLLFFTSPGSGTNCGHVGIFLKGALFFHASSSRGVVVDDFTTRYWQDHWLGAGRVKGK